MVTEERHGRRSHRSPPVGAIAILQHLGRQDAEQQVEQVIGVAAHQGARQQQRLARLGCQHAHGLPLGRAGVLVLVAFVPD